MLKSQRDLEPDMVVVADAETGEEGVRKLVFRFHRPLNSPGYHFYLGSRLRPAYLLTWDGPTSHPTTGKR